MAAPSGTSWGTTVNAKGRLGIYASVTSDNLNTKVNIEVWFWSKWGVTDSSNSYYYNSGSSSATSLVGSKNIKHTVSTGGGWSTSNQTKLGSSSYTYPRSSSTQTKYFAAKLSGIEAVGGTMTVSKSISVPALKKYTVSYNANGGSGAPGSQTKTYGVNLTLSSTIPTRTGYTFNGWATSTSGSVIYQPGSTYTSNSSITLYAKWTAYTYTVSYNANGGSGAPGSQTKTYGVNLTLSSTRPTRTNYNFLGWSTSANGGVNYNPGSTYSSNSSVTLYAVWQLAYKLPRISGFKASRANASGVVSESGTHGLVSFNWSTDRTVTAVYIQWRPSASSTWSNFSVGGSGTNGTVSNVAFGSGSISTETSYIIRVYVSDSGGTTYSSELTLGTIKYPIDVKAGGTGIAFGKVAETSNLFDVGFDYALRGLLTTQIRKNNPMGAWISGRDNATIRNLQGSTGSWSPIASGKTPNGSWELGVLGETFYLSYSSDSNYNAGNNLTTLISFDKNGNAGGLVLPWGNISGKPSTFPPSGHSHTFNQISGNIVYFGNSILEQDGANVFLLNRSSGTLHFRTNNTSNCDFYLMSNSGTYYGHLLPNVTNKITFGSTSYRWYCGYFGQACNTSSDVRLKDNIIPLDSELSMFLSGDNSNIFEKFFFKLIPKAYSLKMENSTEHEGRMHIGMIAQDVEKALNECNLNEKNVAYLTHSYWIDDKTGEEKDEYSLRYEEFIALNIHMIQKAHKKIDEQQTELECLKKQVQDLTNLVLKLTKGGVEE